MNLPNILTVLRVVSVPFFIYFLLGGSQLFRFIAFVVFAVASITDLVDGYLARKWNQETELGKFLDPLADKFLVLGAVVTFVFLSSQIQIWMVAGIVGRDMLITALRYLAIHQGTSMRTSRMGKIKTAFQMTTITIILVIFFLVTYKEFKAIDQVYVLAATQGIDASVIATQNFVKFWTEPNKGTFFYQLASFLPYYLMVFTTIVTVISGIRYLFANYRLLLRTYSMLFRKKGSKRMGKASKTSK